MRRTSHDHDLRPQRCSCGAPITSAALQRCVCARYSHMWRSDGVRGCGSGNTSTCGDRTPGSAMGNGSRKCLGLRGVAARADHGVVADHGVADHVNVPARAVAAADQGVKGRELFSSCLNSSSRVGWRAGELAAYGLKRPVANAEVCARTTPVCDPIRLVTLEVHCLSRTTAFGTNTRGVSGRAKCVRAASRGRSRWRGTILGGLTFEFNASNASSSAFCRARRACRMRSSSARFLAIMERRRDWIAMAARFRSSLIRRAFCPRFIA